MSAPKQRRDATPPTCLADLERQLDLVTVELFRDGLDPDEQRRLEAERDRLVAELVAAGAQRWMHRRVD